MKMIDRWNDLLKRRHVSLVSNVWFYFKQISCASFLSKHFAYSHSLFFLSNLLFYFQLFLFSSKLLYCFFYIFQDIVSLLSVNILLITSSNDWKKKQIILTISVCMFGIRSYYFPQSLKQKYNMIKAYWIKDLNTWGLSVGHSSVQIRLQQVFNNRILWEGYFHCCFIIIFLELSLQFGLI